MLVQVHYLLTLKLRCERQHKSLGAIRAAYTWRSLRRASTGDVQTAAKLLLEPIFESDFDPNAYGYRPKRSAKGAIQKVNELLQKGYTDVVDADLIKYFETIPHREVIQCVARRIVDRDMLHLIKMWLKVPVGERCEGVNRG